MEDIKKKNVQVQMTNRTLKKIDDLKVVLNTNNRSQIVQTSIDIAELVAGIMKDNGRVILEKKDGTRSQIIIPGT